MTHYPVVGIITLSACVLLITHAQDEQRTDLDRLEQRVTQLETPRAAPSRAGRTRPQASALARREAPRPKPRGEGLNLDVTCYVHTGNRTASGVWPRVGMAASNTHPFGTRLSVQGVGVVTVTDRIGHSSELDIFYADRAACLRFGRQHLRVAVVR